MSNFLLLGLATLALGVLGLASMQCTLSVLVKLQAPFTHRRRPQATTDSQQKKLQRAGHKPVCLVPESLDEHLPVPDCTQKGLDTHSEGFSLC